MASYSTYRHSPTTLHISFLVAFLYFTNAHQIAGIRHICSMFFFVCTSTLPPRKNPFLEPRKGALHAIAHPISYFRESLYDGSDECHKLPAVHVFPFH